MDREDTPDTPSTARAPLSPDEMREHLAVPASAGPLASLESDLQTRHEAGGILHRFTWRLDNDQAPPVLVQLTEAEVYSSC